MASLLALCLGGVMSTYLFLRFLLSYTQDAREPPAILTTIPFFGPVLGMMTKKTHFYTDNSDKYGLPIYTLRMPGTRIYVINSTALIPVAQRQFKTLAFPPLEVKAVVNTMAASEEAKEILEKNLNKGEDWDHAFPVSFSKAIHPGLSPGGVGLDAMNRVAISKVAESLERLNQDAPKTVGLFGFVRREVSRATTDAVYGPMNPFADSAIESAFWKFGPGIIILLINLFPSVLAKESIKARELLAKAFDSYFKKGGHKQGSALVKARYDHSIEYNISLSDIARFEIGGAIAIIGNTGPAAFWLIYHIFSDPIVLEDIRNEVSKLVVDGPGDCTIDISGVKVSCPILLSTFQESLRYRSIGTSARVVMEDHMLDGKYLLKKGNTVMIPGPVQHGFASIWGDNVAEFDHKRFIKSSSKKRSNPIAFRGFGGGATLCPGRHFATTEILGYAALMALRFDITPVEGPWADPTTVNTEMWATAPHPDEDIKVRVTRRLGSALDKKWNVLFSGSDKAMEISAEDIAEN